VPWGLEKEKRGKGPNRAVWFQKRKKKRVKKINDKEKNGMGKGDGWKKLRTITVMKRKDSRGKKNLPSSQRIKKKFSETKKNQACDITTSEGGGKKNLGGAV